MRVRSSIVPQGHGMHKSIITANLSGRTRRVTEGGKEYLVAPMTLVVPGVLNGSRGPLFYSPDLVAENPSQWDGVPIVVYHPEVAGRHVSASHPGVIDRSGVGHLRNSRVEGGKLRADGWFEVERTKVVDPGVYDSLSEGQPIELSTGLFTEHEPAQDGASYLGRPYTSVVKRMTADHLAVLPDQKGACSLSDGCGINVNRELTNNPAGQWTPPDAGDAPAEVKRILKAVYSEYRDKHPADHLAVLPDQRGACSVRDGCGINVNYSNAQPRDEGGRWSSGGGGGSKMAPDTGGGSSGGSQGTSRKQAVKDAVEYTSIAARASGATHDTDLARSSAKIEANIKEVLTSGKRISKKGHEILAKAHEQLADSHYKKRDRLEKQNLYSEDIGGNLTPRELHEEAAYAHQNAADKHHTAAGLLTNRELTNNPAGEWTPPEAGDAPVEVKRILAAVYAKFRDEHPAEKDAVKAKGAQIAWGAVKQAGWEKDAEGKWTKKEKNVDTQNQLSHENLKKQLCSLLRKRYGVPDEENGPMLPGMPSLEIEDVFDKTVVYEYNGRTWQLPYTTDLRTDQVSVSDDPPVEVVEVKTYKPVANACKKKVENEGDGEEMDPEEMMTKGDDETVIENAVTKTEGSESLPSSAYAYCPDPKMPSTWKLRIDDPQHVAAAVAAIGKGFRGQKVQIPAADMPAVKKRIRAAWLKAYPDKTEKDLPKILVNQRKKQGDSGSPDTNQEGGSTMNEQERKTLIDSLIDNCDCGWEEGDRATLNAMSDAKLKALDEGARRLKEAEAVANAAREGFEDQRGDAHRYNAEAKRWETRVKEPTANAQPALTKEQEEDIAFARKIRRERRDGFLKKIVTNAEKDQQERVYEVYRTLPDDALEVLANSIPEKKVETPPPSRPSWLGAAVPVGNAQHEGVDKDDVLPEPTINFADWAKLA